MSDAPVVNYFRRLTTSLLSHTDWYYPTYHITFCVSSFTPYSIDNEVRSAIPQYFVELEDAYRNSGIVVPLTYNDPGQRKNFVNGTVSVFPVVPNPVTKLAFRGP